MVLFAGTAAEALVYGEAEGGENDENLFRSLCVLLKPPMSVPEVRYMTLLFSYIHQKGSPVSTTMICFSVYCIWIYRDSSFCFSFYSLCAS